MSPSGAFSPTAPSTPGSPAKGTSSSELRTRALCVRPSGGIFAALDEERRGAVVAKLLPSGGIDPSFGGAGAIVLFKRVGTISVADIVADAAGRLVGVGWEGSGLSAFRLRANGSTDRTFNGGQSVDVEIGGEQETALAVGLQSSGRLVALGGSSCCGPKTFALARFVAGTDRSRCLGKKATVVGTQGPDELTGTPRRDVIASLGGKDRVRGLSGPDLICGGKGKDRLFGGAGRDKVLQ